MSRQFRTRQPKTIQMLFFKYCSLKVTGTPCANKEEFDSNYQYILTNHRTLPRVGGGGCDTIGTYALP